jgi:predicted enzyme related to lactoylglutathione lyase
MTSDVAIGHGLHGSKAKGPATVHATQRIHYRIVTSIHFVYERNIVCREKMMRRLPSAVGHFDIAGPDLAALAGFYSGVLGWTVVPGGPGYAALETPQGSPDGAVTEAQVPALTLGVIVADLARALAATITAGGTVLMPATDNGWVTKALVADPAGNRLTLIQGIA